MPPVRPSLLGALAVLAAVGAGCGGGDEKPATAKRPASTPAASTSVASTPAPDPADFPAAVGRTLEQVAAGAQPGPELAPSVSLLSPGQNRFAFALFTPDGKSLRQTPPLALYVAGQGANARVEGPFPARLESLAVQPRFRSQTTASDPDSARSVYVADLPMPRRGKVRIVGLAKAGGALQVTSLFEAKVTPKGAGPPAVGQPAPRVTTPTLASVGGRQAEIDTRVPPFPDLHRVDFADVLGRKPTVLLFATPQLCQSRVCGPVVDVAAEVQSQTGDRVAFIHQEIYRDNKVERGFRPQVASYRLPTEPWAFVVDRRGRVAERLEGAFSVSELQRAVARVES